MAIPAIQLVDPNPKPTTGGTFRVFGQRFEPGCLIEYVPNYDGWTDLLGSVTATFVNEGFLTTIEFPTPAEAPDGWWTRIRNPGNETSNVVLLTWDDGTDPCPPPPVPTGCVPFLIDSACCADWADYDEALQVRATELAWSTLRTLTGGRVGNCPVVMRPCLSPPCDVCSAAWPWEQLDLWAPRIVNGQWVNNPCGTPDCWCQRLCEIVFPGPVAQADVYVDGELLDPSNWRIDNGNRLVRTDGECWPSCQYVELPADQPGTMAVTYLPGVIPGASGQWAAGVLACEFAKACSGAKCRLPSAVTAVARQGVTMTFTEGMFPGGVTGIREVDAYVWSVNPNHLNRPSSVWSPDLPTAKHRWYAPPAEVTP